MFPFYLHPKMNIGVPRKQELFLSGKLGEPNLYSKNKTPVLGNAKLKRERYLFWLFFKIDLCSAIAMESSRRDL